MIHIVFHECNEAFSIPPQTCLSSGVRQDLCSCLPTCCMANHDTPISEIMISNSASHGTPEYIPRLWRHQGASIRYYSLAFVSIVESRCTMPSVQCPALLAKEAEIFLSWHYLSVITLLHGHVFLPFMFLTEGRCQLAGYGVS